MAQKENIERQIEVLWELMAASAEDLKNPRFRSAPGWVQPRMLGGRDASYHSRVLAQLCRKGCVERVVIGGRQIRNAYGYKATIAGRIFYDMATASGREKK
jgi:hypothetical protein